MILDEWVLYYSLLPAGYKSALVFWELGQYMIMNWSLEKNEAYWACLRFSFIAVFKYLRLVWSLLMVKG